MSLTCYSKLSTGAINLEATKKLIPFLALKLNLIAALDISCFTFLWVWISPIKYPTDFLLSPAEI